MHHSQPYRWSVASVRGGQCKRTQRVQLLPRSGTRLSQIGPLADAEALQGAAGENGFAIGPAHSGPNTNTPVTRSRYELGRRRKRVLSLALASMVSSRCKSGKPSSHRTVLMVAGPRPYRTLVNIPRTLIHHHRQSNLPALQVAYLQMRNVILDIPPFPTTCWVTGNSGTAHTIASPCRAPVTPARSSPTRIFRLCRVYLWFYRLRKNPSPPTFPSVGDVTVCPSPVTQASPYPAFTAVANCKAAQSIL